MKKKLLQFLKEEEGVTMIEYALIAALIAVVSILILTTLGGKVKGTFEKVEKAMP
ncbi:MAG: Flp family type IVb pilin [Candidatus Loosdrechtia sp.]|uniref:Flp family type IVb pilin n=1 Tax=Candidatus Loosdrechtia sp. TaxID=3101272 RepID=UPI003A675B30|nr:MAG: Flp family type IVb pilin [Candidatus Jettenia sp. AMX2]